MLHVWLHVSPQMNLKSQGIGYSKNPSHAPRTCHPNGEGATYRIHRPSYNTISRLLKPAHNHAPTILWSPFQAAIQALEKAIPNAERLDNRAQSHQKPAVKSIPSPSPTNDRAIAARREYTSSSVGCAFGFLVSQGETERPSSPTRDLHQSKRLH